MEDVKTTQLQIRIREDLKEDLRIAANLRGLSLSATIHSLIVEAVRKAKDERPERFPDYDPPPRIIDDEGDMDKMILKAAHEAFEGQSLDPDMLAVMFKAIKAALEVKEVEPATGKIVARIEPGRRDTTRDDVQRMIDSAQLTPPRKKKAG